MSELITELTSKLGINADQAKQGFGAILELLKKKLPENVFARVQEAIPQAKEMLSAAAEKSSGLLGAVSGLASKVLGEGAGDLSALLGKLGHLGLSADQIHGLLTQATDFIKAHVPADVVKQVIDLLHGAKAEAPKA